MNTTYLLLSIVIALQLFVIYLMTKRKTPELAGQNQDSPLKELLKKNHESMIKINSIIKNRDLTIPSNGIKIKESDNFTEFNSSED